VGQVLAEDDAANGLASGRDLHSRIPYASTLVTCMYVTSGQCSNPGNLMRGIEHGLHNSSRVNRPGSGREDMSVR
jgi:hypothetical protein